MKFVKIQIFSPWPGSNCTGTTFFGSLFVGVVGDNLVVLVALAVLFFPVENVDACRALATREMLTDSRPSCSVIDRSGLRLMAICGAGGGAKLCRQSFDVVVFHKSSELSRSLSLLWYTAFGLQCEAREKFLITCTRWARVEEGQLPATARSLILIGLRYGLAIFRPAGDITPPPQA